MGTIEGVLLSVVIVRKGDYFQVVTEVNPCLEYDAASVFTASNGFSIVAKDSGVTTGYWVSLGDFNIRVASGGMEDCIKGLGVAVKEFNENGGFKKPAPKSVYDLKNGDTYWSVLMVGTASRDTFDSSAVDLNLRDAGNMFLTEEAAESAAAYRLALETLRRFIEVENAKIETDYERHQLVYGHSGWGFYGTYIPELVPFLQKLKCVRAVDVIRDKFQKELEIIKTYMLENGY